MRASLSKISHIRNNLATTTGSEGGVGVAVDADEVTVINLCSKDETDMLWQLLMGPSETDTNKGSLCLYLEMI